MAKIMVVAGGDWQVELVKKAKEMGHFVICSNLYENSPAFAYADICEVADVLDKEKNLKIAKKYSPDAVISDQSDIAVPTVAYLNERLGLAGIGTDKADLFTDKSLQREFCKNRGIAIPDFKLCTSIEDAVQILKKYGKIIIKPIDSQSSRGVFTIENMAQLEAKYRESIAYSNRQKAFLAEEYIDGDEFTIDGLVVHGKHYPLCISVKEMDPLNPNISRMQSYSYRSEIYDYAKMRAVNKELVEAIGLSMGLTHSEYKFHNGKFYLLEAGARGGGSNLSAKIVPFMSGIDNYKYLIKEALGEPVDEGVLDRHTFLENRYVAMRFFDFGGGTVNEVKGCDYLLGHPMLIDYQMQVKPGDVLERPGCGRQRHGHFIIGGENAADVKHEAQEIVDHVRVVFKGGNQEKHG